MFKNAEDLRRDDKILIDGREYLVTFVDYRSVSIGTTLRTIAGNYETKQFHRMAQIEILPPNQVKLSEIKVGDWIAEKPVVYTYPDNNSNLFYNKVLKINRVTFRITNSALQEGLQQKEDYIGGTLRRNGFEYKIVEG